MHRLRPFCFLSLRIIELEFKRKPFWAKQAVISAAAQGIEKKQKPGLKLSWPRGQPRGSRQPYGENWRCRESKEAHSSRKSMSGLWPASERNRGGGKMLSSMEDCAGPGALGMESQMSLRN